MKIRDILAQEGLIASRSGSHWDPWPSKAQGKAFESEVNAMGELAKNPKMFYSLYPHLNDKFLRDVVSLYRALIQENRVQALEYARKLDSAEPGFINNPTWSFALDGIKQ